MTGAEFQVVTLHQRPLLLDQTAALLCKQWPRSLEARRHSIEESRDDLPCSLLLVQSGVEEQDKVVGHVRILRVSGETKGTLIEALLVSPELRGRGLGRRLMTAAEEYARRLGYEVVHLSTHDQHAFYTHIGYKEGPPVSGMRKCNTKILLEEVADSHTPKPTSAGEILPQMTTCADPIIQSPLSAPPPPPPPKLKTLKIDEKTMMKWYMKNLC